MVHPVTENFNVAIVCDYRLHAFNRLQKQEEDRRQTSLVSYIWFTAKEIFP